VSVQQHTNLLLNQIEMARKELVRLGESLGFDFQHEELQRKSAELDSLLVQFYHR
jgi:hypothetical protein